MSELIFKNSEARGRNGWFRIAAATVHLDRDRINVNIVSRRAVCPGPVYLELCREDATVLGEALIRCARLK